MRLLRRVLMWLGRSATDQHSQVAGRRISDRYELATGTMYSRDLDGWHQQRVAFDQHRAFAALLEAMRSGNIRRDFQAAADAIGWTGLDNPLIVEVGCGSGYNAQVLSYLLHKPIRYIGLDYSQAMVTLGKEVYPLIPLLMADATALPLPDNACDILFNGGALMHILDYTKVVQESHRVSRRWCIFHTVPVLQQLETTVLKKLAYGGPVVEVIFNESELLELFADSGLQVRRILENITYDLHSVLGEHTTTRTYVCEVT